MTNRLPADTCNFSINVPRAERDAWGRFAYEQNALTGSNQSVADYMRLALALGAELIDTTLAETVKAARAEHLRVKSGIAVLAIGLFAITGALLSGEEIRAARTMRVRLTIQRKEAA